METSESVHIHQSEILSITVGTGNVLTQLILKAVALLENTAISGCVVSDGAQWNRGMWKEFGVSEENPSCEHVSDENRRLYVFRQRFPAPN